MSRPRLRSDLVVVEQSYRGERSYIVKDPATHKYFRFRPLEMMVMEQFDGEGTPAEVAAVLAAQGLPFSVAAVESFARKLAHMDLLARSVAERSVLQMERLRAERQRRIRRTHYQGSLLRMRWSVGDPDRLFDRWTPRLRFFFSRPFLAVSVALFAVYCVIAVAKWSDLSRGMAALSTPSTYTLGTVVLFWSALMAVVCVHELGHGFTCKYFGGQVHELGAMLIYFQPAFYCNVNDAWTFPDLRARLWVTAAGSWIQLVLAALAAIVWWVAQPGTLISQLALFLVVIGGVTTVVANANPLIPLDGYYALSDYLGIPNLRGRALGYMAWLVKRHVLRLAVPPPPADAHERRVFATYGTLAVLYSTGLLLFLTGAIFGWVSRTWGTVGALAFAVALWAMLRERLRAAARSVAASLREHRAQWTAPRRRRWIAGGALAALLLGIVVPWPITVGGPFTAAPPLELDLKAPEGGVVVQARAAEGSRVAVGATILVFRDPDLERRAVGVRRLADSLAAREGAARALGRMDEARRLEAERGEQEARAASLEVRRQALTLRSPVTAVVLTPRLEELVGRRFASGAVAVRLGTPDSVELRVVLERAGATLVRPGQPVALIPYADVSGALHGRVASVATAAAGQGGDGQLEARVLVPRTASTWRAGATGEAKITVRRSNLIGALVWAVRKRVRSDLLL